MRTKTPNLLSPWAFVVFALLMFLVAWFAHYTGHGSQDVGIPATWGVVALLMGAFRGYKRHRNHKEKR